MAFYLDRNEFALLNLPLSLISLLSTIFFSSCLLLSGGKDESVKQPLLLLLWSVVECNGFVHLSVILCVGMEFTKLFESKAYWVVRSFFMQLSSLSTLAVLKWLNFFYFVRIVPAHFPTSVWTKRNIKKVVYWGLAFDNGIVVLEVVIDVVVHTFIVDVADGADEAQIQLGSFTHSSLNASRKGTINPVLLYTSHTLFFYEIVSLGLQSLSVTVCCGATAVYLWKHMKRMQGTSKNFLLSPKLQSQHRVTIMAIVQGVLFLSCSLWIMTTEMLDWLDVDLDKNHRIITSVICLFAFGTNVNLGFGQTLFRQHAALVWHRVARAAAPLRGDSQA